MDWAFGKDGAISNGIVERAVLKEIFCLSDGFGWLVALGRRGFAVAQVGMREGSWLFYHGSLI